MEVHVLLNRLKVEVVVIACVHKGDKGVHFRIAWSGLSTLPGFGHLVYSSFPYNTYVDGTPLCRV